MTETISPTFSRAFQDRLLLSGYLEDARSEGNKYIFARIKKTLTQRGKGVAVGRGVALVYEGGEEGGILTTEKMDAILDEAKAGGYKLPVYIHALGNTAPHAPELYRFQSLPLAQESGAGE